MVSPLRYQLLPPITFFLGSFLLHLLWENAQASLFQGYISFSQHFPTCLKATATGDMLFMLAIYLCLAAVHRDWLWVNHSRSFHHPATWIIATVIGFLLATSFELWAVHVAHRWQYTNIMPIIPFLQIGLTPTLQMIIIPLLTLLLMKRLFHSPNPPIPHH